MSLPQQLWDAIHPIYRDVVKDTLSQVDCSSQLKTTILDQFDLQWKRTLETGSKKKKDTVKQVKKKEIKNEIKKEIKKEKEKKKIVTCVVIPQKCICRVWNKGLGTQCTRDKKLGDFCKSHHQKYENDSLEFGVVTEPRPTHYRETTEIKGKKPGSFIKWKEPVEPKVIEEKVSPNLLESILAKDEKEEEETEVPEIPDFGHTDTETQETLKSETHHPVSILPDLEEDLTVEFDDELVLDGVRYEQYSIDDTKVYIVNEDGKKIAEWNGSELDTIQWVSSEEYQHHLKLSS